MKEISFRLTVDNDDSVRAIFDKYSCYVVKENADEEDNRTHYHGVVYDKGRETVRNAIKTFETPALKGNSLYSIKNVHSNGGTLERAEQYVSKGETEAMLPNVIVNTRGVDVEACHRRYWEERRRINDASVDRKNDKRKNDYSFKREFKKYVADCVDNSPDMLKGNFSRFNIASMLVDFTAQEYGRYKAEMPNMHAMKGVCESMYQYYNSMSTVPEKSKTQRVEDLMFMMGWRDPEYL